MVSILAGLALILGMAQAADRKPAQPQGKKSPDVLPELKSEKLKMLEEAIPTAAAAKPKKERRVLVFWRCEGFYHGEGIVWGNKAIELTGKTTGAWTTDFSDDYAVFTPAKLSAYDAVIFNNTTKLNIPPEGRKALIDFVEGGKGLVGIHAATDNFYDWPEGAKMMGAVFAGHPWTGNGTWAIKISTPDHPMIKVFEGRGFKIKDELYQYKDPYTRADRIVLLQVDLSDEVTNERAVKKGGRKDGDYAMAWVKMHGKGRVFYNALGHNPDPFCSKAIEQLNLQGIQFALGDLDVPATPQK